MHTFAVQGSISQMVQRIRNWNWKRIRRISLGLIVVSIIFLLAVAWGIGDRLIAPKPRTIGPPPDDLPFQTIGLQSESGSQLATWYAAPKNHRATIILVHPLRGSRLNMLDRGRLLFREGFAVVLLDLQAHGESPGVAITAGALEKYDVDAAIRFARETYPDTRIGVIGVSLGGAATLLGESAEIDALVLESVYPTIHQAVHNRVQMKCGPFSYILSPLLIMQIRPRLGFSANELRPIDHLIEFDCPILIAAGDLDQHTPLSESKAMYKLARDPKELVLFEDAAHVDLFQHDPEKYEDRIVSFLKRHLINR